MDKTKFVPKEQIEKLKAKIKQQMDYATEQYKDKINQFKGGLIALEMLEKDLTIEKRK